uniref:Uncharacterized protein n=1 Tax=Zea mays TaxID=4577 RepID=C0PEK4_MAIZE|nr:unknown [Zea mays]
MERSASGAALAYSRFAKCQSRSILSSCSAATPCAARNASSAMPNDKSTPCGTPSAITCLNWQTLSRSWLKAASTRASMSGSTGRPSGRYSGHLSRTLWSGNPSCRAMTPRGLPLIPVRTLPPRSAAATVSGYSTAEERIVLVNTRPPGRSRPSMTATLNPSAIRCRAAARPARPAPTIRTDGGGEEGGGCGGSERTAGARPKLMYACSDKKECAAATRGACSARIDASAALAATGERGLERQSATM